MENLKELKENLEKQKKIAKEINALIGKIKSAKDEEKNFFNSALSSLISELYSLNNSIPLFLEKIKKPESEIRKMEIPEIKIKEKPKISEGEIENLKKPNFYIKFSNKFFGSIAGKISEKSNLGDKLRRANIPLLPSSYISVMLTTIFLVCLVSFVIGIFLAFFSISPSGITFLNFENFTSRLFRNITIVFIIGFIIFIIFKTYPETRISTLRKKIDDELPFVTVHMSAIAGSGIEPSKIFEIIAKSSEYKYFSLESRKVINQIGFYGYDLVTALKNVSKLSPSRKMTELFNGIATTITSGGSLKNYLEEKSKSLLNDYRLERQKHITVAGTYADVYTGLLIAAPLIFMLLLVLINVLGINLGSFSTKTIGIFGIIGIIIINIAFLAFLETSQPKT